jgi:hypothetical protein
MTADLTPLAALPRIFMVDGHLVVRLPVAQTHLVHDLTETELTGLRDSCEARLLQKRADADRLVQFLASEKAKAAEVPRAAEVRQVLAETAAPVSHVSAAWKDWDEVPCADGGAALAEPANPLPEPTVPPELPQSAPVPEAEAADALGAVDLRPGVAEDIAFLRECGCTVVQMPPHADHFFPRFRLTGPEGGKPVVIEQKELRHRAKAQRKRLNGEGSL